MRSNLQKTKAGASAYFLYGKARSLATTGPGGRRRDGEAPLEEQWRSILGDSSEDLPLPHNPGGTKILFATANGFNDFVTGLHSMLAVALQLRGCRAELMACDKALPASDWNINGNWDPPPPSVWAPRLPRVLGLERCRQCTNGLMSTYGQLELPVRRMSDFVKRETSSSYWETLQSLPMKEVRRYEHQGVPVGHHGYATAVRLLMKAELDDLDPKGAWTARRAILGAMVAADCLSRLLDRHRPDVVVMNHGIYLTHGVLVDLATAKGIRVVVHEWSDRKNTFIWSHDKSTHYELIEEPVERWEQRAISTEEDSVLDGYLRSKRSSSRDWLVHHPNPIEDKQRIRKELGLGENDRVIACFTNTMWDAQIHYGSLAYDDMLDWLLHTYDMALRHPEFKFIIREHPGEARIWGRPGLRIRAEIDKRVPTPSNVGWVMAESDISSYSVAEMADVSVVYATKLGLELAAIGLPVVVVGNSFMRNKGLTFDVNERRDYERYLEVEGLEMTDTMKERARRYAYHYYFRRVTEIPYIQMDNPSKGTKVDMGFTRLADLKEGRHPVLDRICSSVADGLPFEFETGS